MKNCKSSFTEPQLFKQWSRSDSWTTWLPSQAEITQECSLTGKDTLLLSLLWLLLLWRRVMLWGFGVRDRSTSVAGSSVKTLETLRYSQALYSAISVCVWEIQFSWHKTAPISVSLRHLPMLERNRGGKRRKLESIAGKERVFMFGRTSLELSGIVLNVMCYFNKWTLSSSQPSVWWGEVCEGQK